MRVFEREEKREEVPRWMKMVERDSSFAAEDAATATPDGITKRVLTARMARC